MKQIQKKGLLKIGIIGFAITALCCFTPILVILLGIAGLGAITGHLDYLLLPLICFFLLIIVYAVVRKCENEGNCCRKE